MHTPISNYYVLRLLFWLFWWFGCSSHTCKWGITVWVFSRHGGHNCTHIYDLLVSFPTLVLWWGLAFGPQQKFLDASCLLRALLVQSWSKNWRTLIQHFYAGWLVEHWSSGCWTCWTCSYSPGYRYKGGEGTSYYLMENLPWILRAKQLVVLLLLGCWNSEDRNKNSSTVHKPCSFVKTDPICRG